MEEDIENYDEGTLGPHPSLLLKEIFANYYKIYPEKEKSKKRKDASARQTKIGLISAVNTLRTCMDNPSSKSCSNVYR